MEYGIIWNNMEWNMEYGMEFQDAEIRYPSMHNGPMWCWVV